MRNKFEEEKLFKTQTKKNQCEESILINTYNLMQSKNNLFFVVCDGYSGENDQLIDKYCSSIKIWLV